MQRVISNIQNKLISLKKRRDLGNTEPPFVCQKLPLIGCTTPSNLPFIHRNIPFVRVKRNLHKQLGVTLVELMITLVIFAIIGAFAIPSFRETLQNHTTTARANEFLTDLNFARSEAIKRGVAVEICAPNPALTACNFGAGAAWATGRIIGVQDPALPPGTLDVLRVREPFSGRSLRETGSGYGSVSFLRTGLAQFKTGTGAIVPLPAPPAVFGLCHDRDNNGLFDAADAPFGRDIRISPTGGIRVSSPATLC